MIRKRNVVLVLSILAAAACDKSSTGAAAAKNESLYAQSDGADNLKGLLDTIVKASEGGDAKKAAALTRGLFPDKAALGKALKDDATALTDKLVAWIGSVPPEDEKVAGVIKRGEPGRTEIQVHGATTEEIAEYKDGSVAYKEFPGGARKLAQSVLRPGVKFYEVEFLEPGKDAGMKFHLFFWDGASWRMLGPAWRFVDGQ